MIDTTIYEVTVRSARVRSKHKSILFTQMPTIDEVTEAFAAEIEAIRAKGDEDEWDQEFAAAEIENLKLLSEIVQFCGPMSPGPVSVAVAGISIGTITVSGIKARTRGPS